MSGGFDEGAHNMKRMVVGLALCGSLAAMVANFCAAGESGSVANRNAPSGVTLEQILDAWKARQARVRSAQFVWTTRKTLPRGRFSRDRDPRFEKSSSVDSGPSPPEDTEFTVPMELSFDGDKMRVSYTNKVWSEEERAFFDQTFISTFNGKVSKSFVPRTKRWPQGVIRPEEHNLEATNLYAQPVLMMYRATHPTMGMFLPKSWVLSQQTPVFNGRQCVVLEEMGESSSVQRALWVDPQREFCIVRYLLTQRRNLEVKLDIEYSQTAQREWVPTRWELVWMRSDGTLRESGLNEVDKSEINIAIPPAQFDVQFPPGTLVNDLKSKPKENYIVLEGGRKRPILPNEASAPYELLINSEPGMALARPASSWFSAWWPFVVGGGVVVLIMIAWWGWRYARARTTPAQ